MLIRDVLQWYLFLGLTVTDFHKLVHQRVIGRMLGLFLYVFLFCCRCTITQPEGCLVLHVRILFQSKVITSLEVIIYEALNKERLPLPSCYYYVVDLRTFVDCFSLVAFFFTAFCFLFGGAQSSRSTTVAR